MKQLFKKLVFVPALLCKVGAFAQAPAWSVNPMDYQYSMTVSAVTSKNCTLLADSGNMIGAFSGTTCRGMARTINVVNGRYVASMVIYSNTAVPETITFKVYNKTANEVFDTKNVIAFEENATFGYAGAPYELYTNRAPYSLALSTVQMPAAIKVGDLVGQLSATDPDSGDTKTYSLVSGIGDTHNAYFSIEGNALKVNAALPQDTTTGFHTRIRVSDQNGCYADSIFVLTRLPLTGIGEVLNMHSLSVYPNPAREQITVEYELQKDALVKIAIYDMAGKKGMCQDARSINGKHSFVVNIEKFKPGIYVLKIGVGNEQLNRKIVIY